MTCMIGGLPLESMERLKFQASNRETGKKDLLCFNRTKVELKGWMAGWDVIDVDEYGDLLVKRGLDPEWRDRVTCVSIELK